MASLAPHRRINANRIAHLNGLGNPPIPLDSDSAESAVNSTTRCQSSRFVIDVIENKAGPAAVEESSQGCLAMLDWLVPKTVTIQFEKIEGAKARRVMMRFGWIR